ncbi:MAG TPA: FHA domain-containing serine/threonine-protein kinase [Planctomycetota bacterium]|nr:FHA domain-containing serine/threonine-protein kinase [Planctomycetota bacterium]
MPRLVVERGNEKGLSCAMDAPNGEVVIGRLQSCNLVITDPLASRRHFSLKANTGTFTLIDHGSHNGTYVNGKRVEGSVPIEFGAAIRAGETLFNFLSDRDSDKGALAGKKIGGYQLVERIGVGGMGEVYKAVQLSLGRQVALKILSPELTSDRTFVERFLREARAAGKLNHPNIVQVHDSGDDHGLYYFSMEFVEGGSVQDLISGGRRLPQDRATEIILQAARALDYAQKIGIVHCDIKPDNLMLTSSGDVRLADLGIAKQTNEKGSADQADGVFGSPHYMAPEQARGLQLDHRSDLYSLGVTFYRMLLGRVPFNGKDAKEIMERQVFDEAEDPRKVDPTLAPLVFTILNRLMRKRPGERYQSAANLIVDLEAAMGQIRSGLPTSKFSRTPVPAKRPGKSRRFWR